MRETLETTFGPFELRLFHSARRALRFAGKLGSMFSQVDGAYAQTDAYENGRDLVLVVTMIEEPEDQDDLSALMSHEAVHVAQMVLKHVGEDDTGSETMAYLVQNATYLLLRMHRKWRDGRGRP